MTPTPAPQIEQVRCRSAVNPRGRPQYPADFAFEVAFGILRQASILTFAAVLISRFSEFGDFTVGAIGCLPALVLLGKAAEGSAGYWLAHLSPARGFLPFVLDKSL